MAELNRSLVSEKTRKVESATLNGWDINISYEFMDGQKPDRIEVSGQKPGTPAAYFSANHSFQDNSYSISYAGTSPDEEVSNSVFETLQAIMQEFETE